MRLTLRTLLAYLDDLLEPAQAKELGAKIQESEMAAELIMRIRDVIRKRRLTAPVVSGPACDLDANLVAEYLDNTLSPEGVTNLERICLESESHLAEVAACHQILTLVLGEPVDIGAHSRERMYALGQSIAPQPALSGDVAAKSTVQTPSSTGIVGKPNPNVITPATVSLKRPIHSESVHPSGGDSFIGRPGPVAYSNANPQPRGASGILSATGNTTGPSASGVQSASSAIHSSTSHSGPLAASTAKPAGAMAGLAPAVKPVAVVRAPSGSIPASPGFDAQNPNKQASVPAPIEPFDRTIPDYLKQAPVWKRALPLAILVLVAVWGGMLLKDKNLLSGLYGTKAINATGKQLAANDTADQGVDQLGVPGDKPEPAVSNVSTDVKSEHGDQQPKVEPKPAESNQVAVGDTPAVDAPPPIDAGDPVVPNEVAKNEPDSKLPMKKTPMPGANETAKAKVPDAEVPDPTPAPPKTGIAVAAVDTKKPGDLNPVNANPAKPAKSALKGDNRPKPARYIRQDGVLLRLDADRDGWFPQPPGAFVFAEDFLAVPEPFDAQIQFGAEKHRLTAVGPSLLQIVETMDDLPLGINVERGRIVLQPAELAGNANPTPLKLSLTVQGLTWLLEVADTNSKCGIEIIPREPHQFEENFGAQAWSGKLFIVNGPVKITTPEGQTETLTGPETYVLAPEVGSPTTGSAPSKVLPGWMSDRKLSSVAKINAGHFQRTLRQEDTSAHEALLAAVNDRNPERSRLATACLGLVGDFQVMLEALERNEHHESREAAIIGLRSWVNLNPVNREKLKAELGAKFIKEDGDTIYKLIWGYQEQDLRGKQVSRQLVDLLEHDNVAVRELAYFYIKSLTGRRIDFDARGPQTQRNATIQQLNKVLSKDGALLPPLPKGAGGALNRN